MAVVNKFYSLDFDLVNAQASGPSFGSLYGDFRNDNFNHCYGQGLVFYVDTSSHSIGYKPVTYWSDTQTLLTKGNFTSEVNYLMRPSEHWFYAFCLSTNSSDHSALAPSLELNFIKDTSMFHEQGNDYLVDQISNFKFEITYTLYGLTWSTSDPSLDSDIGLFTISNKEGFEPVSRQPVWDWWEIRDDTQIVNIRSDSGAYLATPDKGGFDSALDIVGSSFGSLTSLLDHQLIGGFTIGAIIAIPLCLTLVVTLIKALKK